MLCRNFTVSQLRTALSHHADWILVLGGAGIALQHRVIGQRWNGSETGGNTALTRGLHGCAMIYLTQL